METPTWYSIRNRLEAGEVNSRSSFERFLAILCSTYSCLDVWYRKAQTTKGVLFKRSTAEVKIMFMQEEEGYVASNSWERDGERARLWQLFQGTEAEIRKSVIGVLPSLTSLHDGKRHGEYNFGKKQPYTGQGGLTYTLENGTTILSGRFGDIVLNADGIDFNWEDLVWEFRGCNAQVTYPYEVDEVCQKFFGSIAFNCDDTNPGPPAAPIGCCFLPRPSCEELFQMTDEQLAALNAPDYTEAKCLKFKGAWQGPNTLCVPFNEQSVLGLCGNPKPLGCCIIGDCLNYSTISGATLSTCGNSAGNQPFLHITDTFDCSDDQAIRDALGCLPPEEFPWGDARYPQTITLTVSLSAIDQTAGLGFGNTWNLGGNSNTVEYTYGLDEGLLTVPPDVGNDWCPANDASCGQGGVAWPCSRGYDPEESDIEWFDGSYTSMAINQSYTLKPVLSEVPGTYSTEGGSIDIPSHYTSIQAINSRFDPECVNNEDQDRTFYTLYYGGAVSLSPFQGNVVAGFTPTVSGGQVTASIVSSGRSSIATLVTDAIIDVGQPAVKYHDNKMIAVPATITSVNLPTYQEALDLGYISEIDNILSEFLRDTPVTANNTLSETSTFPILNGQGTDTQTWEGFRNSLTIEGSW